MKYSVFLIETKQGESFRIPYWELLQPFDNLDDAKVFQAKFRAENNLETVIIQTW